MEAAGELNLRSIKFKVVPIAWCILASLIMSLISRPGWTQAPAPRKIGVVVATTGNLASIGVGIRNAIILADRENDLDDRVNFIFEDDGFESKRAVSSVMKLIESDKVHGLIVFGSGGALAVKEIAERNKIPMIALGNSKKILEGKKYVMMHFLNTDTENEAVIKHLAQLPYRQIAVITSSHDAMLDLSKAFCRALPDRVAISLDVSPSINDFRAEITRIKASGADAVYNILLPGAASLFAKQLREMGYRGELFSAHGVDDWNEVKTSQGALLGTWFVTGNVIRDETFVSRYQAMFNDTPKVATPNGYDAAKLFISASSTADMNSYLHQVRDFQGIMGTYGLHPSGYFELPAAIRRITPNGFVPLN